jgi:hypothetical protein
MAHVACMGEMKVLKNVIEEPEGRWPHGRHGRRWGKF